MRVAFLSMVAGFFFLFAVSVFFLFTTRLFFAMHLLSQSNFPTFADINKKIQVVKISTATVKSAHSIELKNFSFSNSILVINVYGTDGGFSSFNMDNMTPASFFSCVFFLGGGNANKDEASHSMHLFFS
jgi:hypothetical protein